jgi:hypothetical protein
MIPVMFGTMTNKNTIHLFNSFNKFLSLHAISSSPV